MRRSRAPRVARGAVAATVATWVALLSHVTAGGDVPGWLGLLVPWVLSLSVCTMLAGRTLSLVRLSLAVVVSQVLFHLLFVLGAAASPAAGHLEGHVHGAHIALSTGSAVPAAPFELRMWVGHAVAAFLTVAAIYRGERAARRLQAIAREAVAWVRRKVVPSLTFRFALTPAVRLPAVIESVVPLRDALAISLLRHRGPPRTIVL
ncbi:hypothetical protein AB1K54_08070 [Microbacterium sp. BWT-B31]|uniref:hypothetical protein n=1 Tax=Microbacterium sp. BWT-B31 TaxID=3232072 RepID=UPI00352772CD